jgi:hypothetical protein
VAATEIFAHSLIQPLESGKNKSAHPFTGAGGPKYFLRYYTLRKRSFAQAMI